VSLNEVNCCSSIGSDYYAKINEDLGVNRKKFLTNIGKKIAKHFEIRFRCFKMPSNFLPSFATVICKAITTLVKQYADQLVVYLCI